MWHLDGDESLQLLVVSQIDEAETAFSQNSFDAVAPDPLWRLGGNLVQIYRRLREGLIKFVHGPFPLRRGFLVSGELYRLGVRLAIVRRPGSGQLPSTFRRASCRSWSSGRSEDFAILLTRRGLTASFRHAKPGRGGWRLHHAWFPDEARFEGMAEFPEAVKRLRAMGHIIVRTHQGDAHTIWVNPKTGEYVGAEDRRIDGKAAGF